MIKFPAGDGTADSLKEKIRLAKALSAVGRLEECLPFVRWLKLCVETLEKTQRRERDKVLFRQRQGALQVLDTILFEISSGDDRFRGLHAHSLISAPDPIKDLELRNY